MEADIVTRQLMRLTLSHAISTDASWSWDAPETMCHDGLKNAVDVILQLRQAVLAQVDGASEGRGPLSSGRADRHEAPTSRAYRQSSTQHPRRITKHAQASAVAVRNRTMPAKHRIMRLGQEGDMPGNVYEFNTCIA